MNFRKISIVAGAGVLAGSLYFGKIIGTEEEKKAFKAVASAQVVNVLPVSNATVNAQIPITGKLEASNRIEIYAEVPGIYRKAAKAFKEGNHFKKGDLLIAIDSDEAYQNLLAQRSNLHNLITTIMPDLKLDYPEDFEKWDAYLKQLDVRKTVKPLPEPSTDRVKYFITAKNIYNQYYTIKSLEERLSKYRISAPFTGVVAESTIDPGTLVRSGQKMGEFIDPGKYELHTTITVKDLAYIKEGDEVVLNSSDINGQWKGKIARISDKIDPSTQSVNVFVEVNGDGLKEGMFLTGALNLGAIDDAEAIPRNILLNDKEIYVVKDSQLRKTAVEIVRFAADSAIVRGLPDGTEILNESIPGAYEGMRVQANTSK